MGWSIGGPDARGRFVGYGVVAYCDHPKCNETIDRGLSYVCGGEPFGGDDGCGLYFCGSHLHLTNRGSLCPRCTVYRSRPYARPKPEHPEWMTHVLTDDSWAEWRTENPEKAEAFRVALAASLPKSAFENLA